jgi:hypothetical protein
VLLGVTLTVTERTRADHRADIGLFLYFARYASSMRSFTAPSTGLNVTSFVIRAAVIQPVFRWAA